MLGSTTHVIEDIDSMGHLTEHVALITGHGVEQLQSVKVHMTPYKHSYLHHTCIIPHTDCEHSGFIKYIIQNGEEWLREY